MTTEGNPGHSLGLRERLHEIIFEADTPAGKRFDVVLLCVILLSVLVVMLDSVASMNAEFGEWLRWWEWLFTIPFTIEYLLRLYSVRRPLRYALSFFGLVDLMAVIPTYQDFLFGRPGAYTIADYRLRCNGFRTAARFGTPFAAAAAFECWPIMAFQRSQRAL